MNAAGPKPPPALALAAAMLIAGCSFEIPDFLGREGAGSGTFTLGGSDGFVAEPVQVPLRDARIERSYTGVILRAEAIAPSQGFYGARLRPLDRGAPDASGIVSFELVAVAPEVAAAVGPEPTRLLTAAAFLPNRTLGDIEGFRIGGAGTARTLPLPDPLPSEFDLPAGFD